MPRSSPEANQLPPAPPNTTFHAHASTGALRLAVDHHATYAARVSRRAGGLAGFRLHHQAEYAADPSVHRRFRQEPGVHSDPPTLLTKSVVKGECDVVSIRNRTREPRPVDDFSRGVTLTEHVEVPIGVTVGIWTFEAVGQLRYNPNHKDYADPGLTVLSGFGQVETDDAPPQSVMIGSLAGTRSLAATPA
jgi:hypothetical protein